MHLLVLELSNNFRYFCVKGVVMKKSVLFLLITINGISLAFSQEFFIDTVFFDFDQYDLKQAYKSDVDSITRLLNEYPSYYIEIFGHTDNIGTEYYNQQLSENRAKEVYEYLLKSGLDEDRLYYEGFGTQKPAASNETFSGREKNRRAEVAVIYTLDSLSAEDASELISGETGTAGSSNDEESEGDEETVVETETLEAGDRPLTVFTNRNTVVYGEEGTRVLIPAEAFDTDEEKVTMEMVELFDRSDMLMVGMPTVTSDGPLETEGMVMLEARNSRGRLVKVRPEKPITVEIPAQRPKSDLSVYEGRGGNRTSRLKRATMVQDFNAVRNWVKSDIAITHLDTGEIGPHYEFKVTDLERFNLARSLHIPMETDPEVEGFDFEVKLKGKRFEKDTKVLLVGSELDTFIPLRKNSKRVYTGTNIQEINPGAEMIVFATQEDNKGTPYIATRRVVPEQDADYPKKKFLFFTIGRDELARKLIFVKVKLKKKKGEEFMQILNEL